MTGLTFFFEKSCAKFRFNGILLIKLFWPFVRKSCSRDWEKLLIFKAEDREFANFLRSLKQFIQMLCAFTGPKIFVPEQKLMPCPFTGPKMFCAIPNFLSQSKDLTEFSASSKTFVPAQKPILLNANHLFVWHKMFVTCTINE